MGGGGPRGQGPANADSLKGGPGAGTDSSVRSAKEDLQYPMMDELLATFEAAGVFTVASGCVYQRAPNGGRSPHIPQLRAEHGSTHGRAHGIGRGHLQRIEPRGPIRPRLRPMAASRPAELEVLCFADPEVLCRPCVDCGRNTGRFCDYCLAAKRIPSEQWGDGQHTPLCSTCDNFHLMCRYCRGVHMARPFAWGGALPRSEDMVEGDANCKRCGHN